MRYLMYWVPTTYLYRQTPTNDNNNDFLNKWV